jgi:hypothetical protein
MSASPVTEESLGHEADQPIIHAQDFYDPLMRFCFRPSQHPGVAVSVLAIFLAALSAAGLYGWLTMGVLTPLQEVFGSLVVPIWVGIYVFLPVTMADLFNRLRGNDVIGDYRGQRPHG